MATFELERGFSGPVIGIDEAGRGPWAGPVVVAGVCFKTYEGLPDWVYQLNDSKKISVSKRNDLFAKIRAYNTFLACYITTIDVFKIDQVNILEATMEGMRNCIDVLRTDENTAVLADGNRKPVNQQWCHAVTKGDSISLSIAAASILAKVYRDNLMAKLAEEHPEYGWEKNAGYGTAQHKEALLKYGITKHHRKSFAPIRALSI